MVGRRKRAFAKVPRKAISCRRFLLPQGAQERAIAFPGTTSDKRGALETARPLLHFFLDLSFILQLPSVRRRRNACLRLKNLDKVRYIGISGSATQYRQGTVFRQNQVLRVGHSPANDILPVSYTHLHYHLGWLAGKP